MSENEAEGDSAGGELRVPAEPSFHHIVQTFAVPAMIWTGQVPNPMDEEAKPNLELARYQIGLLEILEKKTKGNLDKEEEDFLVEMLSAARFAFVRATQQKAEASAARESVPAEGEKQEDREPAEEGEKGEGSSEEKKE